MPASDSRYERFLESLEPFSVGLNSCAASLDRMLHWKTRQDKQTPISLIDSKYKVDWVGEKSFDVIGELSVTAEHPETKKRILQIGCAFEVHFHSEAECREEHVNRFAQEEFRVFVWPYFRQFV